MDDIVKQALLKWPNVPECYGWLGLDMRGQWWLRDAQTQAQGTFPDSKGSRVEHAKLLAFIGRNYESDAQGQWFFQNGPQRVYVELENTPMVWRVEANGQVVSHTEQRTQQVKGCWQDEQGLVYLQCDGVLGLVHSQDMVNVAEMVEAGQWQVLPAQQAALPKQFDFVRSPLQRQKGR